MGKIWALLTLVIVFGPTLVLADDESAPPPLQLIVSVAEQKMALLREGGLVRKYPISTSKFGLGDSFNSYRTPLGRLRICSKIGDDMPMGAVFKARNATGEILAVNAPGRDPIVTRILWLEGLESQNANARSRGIYIHGTVEESKLGQPVSYGCIRMRSVDVVEVFEQLPVGTPVEIIEEKLPRFRKYSPKTETLFASNAPRDTIITTIGPKGVVTVRTVRNSTPVPTEPVPSSTRLATAKLPLPRTAVGKVTETEPKTPAKAPAAPHEEGPRLVFTSSEPRKKHPIPPAPPSETPRVIFNMSGSMLVADLGKETRASLPAISSGPEADEAPEAAAADAEEIQYLVDEVLPTPLHFIALDLSGISFALLDEEAGPLPVIDAFSQLLLEPPAEPFRLAQRAREGQSDL